ncbi:MAG TPA: hypothetical protein DCG57_17450, partial [Candidatus Riflebacteria bacterium]|nr:hypothetical protein [Candidatus Riflebacteria bacterium]
MPVSDSPSTRQFTEAITMKPQSPETTRIFLVEDHPVMRLGLKMMLQERGYIICGEAASESEATTLLPGAQADIAIFDLSLNGET